MLSCFNKTSFHIQFVPRDVVAFGLCRLVLLLFITTLLSSCSTTSLLPRQQKVVVTPWSSFEEEKKAFDLITPYQTKKNELEQLGFDPKVTPNIKILNYLDLIERFMPNQSITIEDLALGMQDCLSDQEQCIAYEIIIRKFNSQRFGNVFADLLNFRRKITVSGWEFRSLIVLKNSLVVYKLSSGTPKTDELHDALNPLGPLQSSDKFLWTIVH